MSSLSEEAALFQRENIRVVSEARQWAALQLACGLDLATALGARAEDRSHIVARLTRRLRRERLRGLSRHWSYDLNRHIALKQVLDRLLADAENDEGGSAAASGSHANV
jgi:hypothetical protein